MLGCLHTLLFFIVQFNIYQIKRKMVLTTIIFADVYKKNGFNNYNFCRRVLTTKADVSLHLMTFFYMESKVTFCSIFGFTGKVLWLFITL
jgi:hypothetical protein